MTCSLCFGIIRPMKTKHEILLLVDCQYDFIHGSLEVPGAYHKMGYLCDWLGRGLAFRKLNYDYIWFTLDWHPYNHCSFKENGGMWPRHCVQHTDGAAIFSRLYETVMHSKIPFDFILKGTDKDTEEYSAFHKENSTLKFLMTPDFMDAVNPEDVKIDVAGIAYDYCVKNCVVDIAKAQPKVEIRVLRKFCPFISDGSEAEATGEMRAYPNIKIVDENEPLL